MRYIISFLLASLAAPAAYAEVPRVVTDLPPVQSLAALVMGDLGSPDVLVEKGSSAHFFQLRPSQAAGLAAAGLVIWIGPEMTPSLDRTLSGLSDAPQLRLLTVQGTHLQSYGESGHDDHDENDDHDEDGDAHSGTDPHAWLDPANAQVWLAAIAAELSRIDPEHAATYARNAQNAASDISALDVEIAALLAPIKDRPLVVSHQAYGYFAAHYGLNIAASVAKGDASAPGAAHLDKVQAALTAAPTCLFPEANHDPKRAAQLAEDTGARLGGALDPEGAALTPGPGLYADLMRGLATTMAACLTP